MRPGRHDPAQRRQSTRGGRRRGCYIYIAGEQLEALGIDPNGPAPWYRVWPRKGRKSAAVSFYTEA